VAVATLTALGSWSGCTGSPDPSGEYLADLLPIVSHGVSTDVILPSFQDSIDFLGSAWEELSNARQTDEGLWVLGRSGTFRFYVAMGGPVTLELENYFRQPEVQHLDGPVVFRLHVGWREITVDDALRMSRFKRLSDRLATGSASSPHL
jgi:hypothetical protein